MCRSSAAFAAFISSSVLGACSLETEPLDVLVSPVGTYALFGCSGVSADTRPSAPQSCGTGGSGRHTWPNGRFELRVDGSAFRVLEHDFSAFSVPQPPTVDSLQGTWTRSADTVTVVWQGRSPSTVVRIGRDTLRDNTVFNDQLFFWFVRPR